MLLGKSSYSFDGLLDYLGERNGIEPHRQLSCLELLYIQQIVYQADQSINARLGGLNPLYTGLVELAISAILQQCQCSLHRRKRRAKVMTDHRHKFLLQSLDFMPLGNILDIDKIAVSSQCLKL